MCGAAGKTSVGPNPSGGPPSKTPLTAGPERRLLGLCPASCVYVGADETLQIIDQETLAIKQAIPVPISATEGIKSVAVTPDESLVAAGLNRNHDGTLQLPLKNGSVLFMNPVTGQITSQIDFPKPAFPASMVFTSDGETLYALDRANFTLTPEPARLYVIDVSSRAITKTIPLPAPGSGVDLALTPDDAVLFISVTRTDERGAKYTELFPLDTRTATFNGVIRLPGFNPGPIAMNPSGTRIYAPHRSRPIMVIDTATYEISDIPGVIAGVSDPYGAVLSSDGRYLLISATNSLGITVVDTVAGANLGVIEAETRIVGPVVVLP